MGYCLSATKTIRADLTVRFEKLVAGGPDLNRQPPGYEPDELPDCSTPPRRLKMMVEGTGFEPVKALPADLQSAPFGQLGYPSTPI